MLYMSRPFGRDPYVKKVTLYRDGLPYEKEVQFFGWEKLDAVDLIRSEFGL